MNSLIDLSNFPEPINKLIDKLANGVGWIANRDTPQKTAINTYIEDIKKSNYDPLTKAALISNAKKTIKEYCNQYDIFSIATEFITSTANPENVEDDWLKQIMNKAKHVSDKEFQLIWGKILAEECNVPNSIPKSLLNILEQMDRNDAMAFSSICSISVHVDENVGNSYSPIIRASNIKDFYSKTGTNYDSLVDLQALGLIEMTFGAGDCCYSMTCYDKPVFIKYYANIFELPEGMDSFDTGNIIYTKAGNALCKAINVSEPENFWEEHCLPFLQKQVKEFNEKQKSNST